MFAINGSNLYREIVHEWNPVLCGRSWQYDVDVDVAIYFYADHDCKCNMNTPHISFILFVGLRLKGGWQCLLVIWHVGYLSTFFKTSWSCWIISKSLHCIIPWTQQCNMYLFPQLTYLSCWILLQILHWYYEDIIVNCSIILCRLYSHQRVTSMCFLVSHIRYAFLDVLDFYFLFIVFSCKHKINSTTQIRESITQWEEQSNYNPVYQWL